VVLASALAMLAGCATVSQMQATGGSRSDGIVKLSFEYGMFDKVQLDEGTALQTARQRCGVWGYTDADAFGGITRQCQAYSGTLGCTHWFVTKEYQCTMGGGGAPPLTQAAVPSPGMVPPPMRADAAGGPRMVRAKTASGYCLDAPPGYQGTGAANSPAITSGMPRCDQLSAGKNDSPLHR
jgi:hypothetical protein